MAYSHYVMDSYFPDDAKASGFRREPPFYEIRAIMTSTRSGDRLIHGSRTNDGAAIEPATPADPVGSPA